MHRIAERLDDLGVAARSGVAYDRFGHFGIRGGIDGTAVGEMRRDHTAQRLVIAVVDDFGSAAGENHLLVAFLFQIDEILLMGVADRSEDHRVGADDAFEPLHLAGFRDARFENRQFLVALQHQH